MAKTYDPNVDYKKKMDEAAANGDLEQAAYYEEKRNEKIKGEGLSQYTLTHQYRDYLPKTTEQKMEEIFDKLQSREPFSYDLAGDKLYETYKTQYTKAGSLAREDAAAQAAGLTGGYGNSYGQTLGQRAYEEVMAGLDTVANQLYDRARDAYDEEGQALQYQYESLAKELARETEEADKEYARQLAAEKLEYDRQLAAEKLEYDRETAREKLEYDRLFAQQQQDYERQQAQEKLEYDRQQAAAKEEYNKQKYLQDQALSLALSMLSQGLMPSQSVLETSGLEQSDVEALYHANQPQQGSNQGGSSGGSNGGGSGTQGGYSTGSSGNKTSTSGNKTSSGSSSGKTGSSGKTSEKELTNTLWEKLRTAYRNGQKEGDLTDFIQLRSMLEAQGYGVRAFDTWARSTYGKDYTTGAPKTIHWDSVLALGYGPLGEAQLRELVAAGKIREYTQGDYIYYSPTSLLTQPYSP